MVTKKKASKAKTEQFTARLDATRKHMLTELAEKNGASKSSMVAIAITQMHERDCGGKK